jgi:hypothetical protein
MRPIDAKPLGESLAALAEVFGARPPSPAAVAVWADALRDFPIERVQGLLRSWPKMHTKMPVPRDVWSILNDERTEDIERRNAAEKQQERNEVQRMFDPRVRNENMAKIREMIAVMRGRGMPTGPELAQRMLDDASQGKVLSFPQRAFIRHNLGWTEAQMDEAVDAGQAYAREHGLLPWKPAYQREIDALDALDAARRSKATA